MIKKLSLLLLLSLNLFGLDIDVKTFETIVTTHPDAYKERIILAKYYLKHGDDAKANKERIKRY